MVTIKSKKEIELMREACRITNLVYKEIEKVIKPGMSTLELDNFAGKIIKENGGIPAQKGYPSGQKGVPPFPAVLCISINDEVIHGIPSKRAILKEGDVLIIQFPLQEGFIFASHLLKNLKKKNIKTIAVIHDLETLRITKDNTISKKRKIRLYIEEIPALKQFSKIVVHNQSMKKALMKKGISEDSMVTLKMFDYLIKEGNELPESTKSEENNIIIAGNLSSYKVGYVYELPHDVKFDLYGINYTGVTDNKIKYHGSYPSDELPWHLKGAYGLVWDGDTAKTCSGIFGDYLRINNPHKTSLYLACGIPIITWNKAAIAQYVRKNRVGITVSSLDEINEKLKDVSKDEYNLMRKNAKKCSERVRKGYYLKKAIQEALS